jgi:hypothetical protein
MNQHLYRIIFNARRGLRMAVAETARCGHQGATGGTRANRRKQRSERAFPESFEPNRPLALLSTPK